MSTQPLLQRTAKKVSWRGVVDVDVDVKEVDSDVDVGVGVGADVMSVGIEMKGMGREEQVAPARWWWVGEERGAMTKGTRDTQPDVQPPS